MFRSLLRVSKRFHIRLNLLKLLRQRIDLRDLVVDHLNVLREVQDMVCLSVRNRGRIDYNDLRAQERRAAEQSEESKDGFHNAGCLISESEWLRCLVRE